MITVTLADGTVRTFRTKAELDAADLGQCARVSIPLQMSDAAPPATNESPGYIAARRELLAESGMRDTVLADHLLGHVPAADALAALSADADAAYAKSVAALNASRGEKCK